VCAKRGRIALRSAQPAWICTPVEAQPALLRSQPSAAAQRTQSADDGGTHAARAAAVSSEACASLSCSVRTTRSGLNFATRHDVITFYCYFKTVRLF
jgi:hypothetical protein